MEHHEFRRREMSLSEMLSSSPQSHDAFIKGYRPTPRNNPYVGRMNTALVTSAKKTMESMKNGLENNLGQNSVNHRNLASYLAYLSTLDNNTFSLNYNLSLIVNVDSDQDYVYPYPAGRPWDEKHYSVVKDNDGKPIYARTLDGITHEIPAFWNDPEGTREIDETGAYSDLLQRNLKAEWENQLAYLLYDRKIDLVVVSDSPKLFFGRGIPGNNGVFPLYSGRIAVLEDSFIRGEDAETDAGRVKDDNPTVMSLITQDGGRIISDPDPSNPDVKTYGSRIVAATYGFDLLANSPNFRSVVSYSRKRSEAYDRYEDAILFNEIADHLKELL